MNLAIGADHRVLHRPDSTNYAMGVGLVARPVVVAPTLSLLERTTMPATPGSSDVHNGSGHCRGIVQADQPKPDHVRVSVGTGSAARVSS